MAKKIAILALLFLISVNFNTLIAQDHSSEHPPTKQANSSHFSHKNEIAGFAGATYIFQSGFVLPTFGVEYIRNINSFMGIGLIAEIEVGSHIIGMDEHSNEEAEVNRESAFLLLPAIYFKTGNFITSFGYGVELEKSENLGLLKISAMYLLELKGDKWVVVPNVSWDHTTKFDGLVYGFSVARRF